MAEAPKVLIILGSKSDLPVMEDAGAVLGEFGAAYETTIASAHRTPEKVRKIAMEAREKGVKVIIAGAGYAASLAGAIAANTILPVIGVPLASSALAGVDALLATAQMPGGVPVATMSIGKAGAKNAALLAVQILALSDEGMARKLLDYKKKMADKIEEEDRDRK